MFVCCLADGTVVDKGSPCDGVCASIDEDGRIHKVTLCVFVTDSHLGGLRWRASYDILMTPSAGPIVEQSAESTALACGDGAIVVLLFESLLIQRKGVATRFDHTIADALRSWILNKGRGSEPGWGFGCMLLCDDYNCRCQASQAANEKGRLSVYHVISSKRKAFGAVLRVSNKWSAFVGRRSSRAAKDGSPRIRSRSYDTWTAAKGVWKGLVLQ
jgi:hypothetical protein